MSASAALAEIRDLLGTGLRDQSKGWHLVHTATAEFPDDDRIDQLRVTMVDLLVAIELETILGGDFRTYQKQLTALLDWIDNNPPEA